MITSIIVSITTAAIFLLIGFLLGHVSHKGDINSIKEQLKEDVEKVIAEAKSDTAKAINDAATKATDAVQIVKGDAQKIEDELKAKVLIGLSKI